MSYNYTQFVSYLVNTLVITPPTDPNFVADLPIIIDTAEQRVYRDLDLLNTFVSDASATLTANTRFFQFPQHFVVSEVINVFTPPGVFTSSTNRIQLVPVSKEFLNAVYPNEIAISTPSIPQYYAMFTDQSILVGPPPDAAYTLEVQGTVRPTPLSSTNTTTYLTLYLPDLFFAASMAFAAGYLQNYGAQADNPQMATSWESTYQALKASADIEENRKKYASQAWSSKQPTPLATPPRA